MQIQEIIRGKKGKLTVRLEGGLSFPIYEKEAAKYRMTEGGSLSDQEWNEICTEILEFFFSCQAPDGSYHAAVDYSDPENEAVVQRAVAKLVEGKTVIVIAHRLSTITGADQIVVVQDGSIEAQGRHEELLRHCPLYADLWQAHMGVKEGETV